MKAVSETFKLCHAINCAFGQGQSASRRDDYRADNPYMQEGKQGILHDAWLAGYEFEEGPAYQLAKQEPST
jgi:hypothetical protein